MNRSTTTAPFTVCDAGDFHRFHVSIPSSRRPSARKMKLPTGRAGFLRGSAEAHAIGEIHRNPGRASPTIRKA